METLAKITGAADRLLSKLVAFALVLALCYGGYALWDTYKVYQGASVDGNLLKYKPTLNQQAEDNPTLAELIALNPDVRGWLTIDNTHIDYPLLQGTNNVKYVNTDVYNNFSLSGSVFMDFSNAGDVTDFYTLVYGHHMEGGAMFGDLEHFTQAQYFDEHPTGTLFLPDYTYDIRLFACLMVDAFDPYVFHPLVDDGKETEMLQYLKETAVQYRETVITPQDHIIGLSTCSDAATNARTVVFGLLSHRQAAEEGGNAQ